VRHGPGGVPVLRHCRHWLAARRGAVLDEGGDHVCFLTEPVTVHGGEPFEPLRLSQATHLEPGHGNEERPGPPTERSGS
jgi:flavin reductase (DIM6/NTAB) family NADH-FMN oxidoreductase RutF